MSILTEAAAETDTDTEAVMSACISKIQPCKRPVSEELASSELNPLLQQLYANRGVTRLDQLDYSLSQLADYHELKDIQPAADIIAEHIIENRKIIIVGDFDVDGATSSALMIRALQAFGATRVSYLVPNRFKTGYGLGPEIVALADEQSAELIITVDNGIASIEGVAEANQRHIKVVVTDHHLPAETTPAAAAIVNPNQHGCLFPCKNTAGVGVAFYVMLAVRARLRESGRFSAATQPNMAVLLDLVALGTVADVVPLDRNNRLLVALGLQRIQQNRGCAGINALLSIAGKNSARCSSQDFGFVIGPRLNAAGRLEDMSIGIECLLSDDDAQALSLAQQLDDINHQRRQIEADMLSQALHKLETDCALPDPANQSTPIDAGLALYHPDWHQGVVGLIASRVKEKYHRPVFAFANAEQVGVLKGSGRSIPGLHIRDTLDLLAKSSPDLILKFGGHAMAAGLSIRTEKFELFRQLFNHQVSLLLDEKDLTMVRQTDGSVPPDFMTIDFSLLIKYAGPWGQAFPEPLFDDVFSVDNWSIVGKKHLKMRLKQIDHQRVYNAIAFNMDESVLPAGDIPVRVVYRLDVNEFRGNRSLQLIVNHIEAAA